MNRAHRTDERNDEGTIRRRGDRYEFAVRIDTSDVDARQLKRAGFEKRKYAQAGLDQVRDLVNLAGSDDRLRRKIGDMIFEARYGRPLPSVDEVSRRIGVGREPDAQMYTVAEWLDIWLAERGHLSAATRGDYTGHIEYHLKPHLGTVQLDKLDSRHIRAMFNAINTRNDVIKRARAAGDPVPYDPLDRRGRVQVTGLNTQGQILKTLRAALYTAMGDDHRLIDRNPAQRFSLNREVEDDDAPARMWWSSAQVGRFLEAIRDDRLHALWRVALLRGLRRGELLALRWADVDLQAKTLQVRRGKTRSSRRTVSLDAGTVAALREHRSRQLEERLATFGAYDDHDLVFAREDGTPIPPHKVTFGFKKLARLTGLPVMRFHDTRHTAASIALEAGNDIKVVSDMLGHSTIRITYDLYQHVARRLHDEAAERSAALVDLP